MKKKTWIRILSLLCAMICLAGCSATPTEVEAIEDEPVYLSASPITGLSLEGELSMLADSIAAFDRSCVSGIRANREKMQENLHNSLMLVTALNPHIGYENAAKTAKLAYAENISLREACTRLGFLTEEEFDRVFHPEQMI